MWTMDTRVAPTTFGIFRAKGIDGYALVQRTPPTRVCKQCGEEFRNFGPADHLCAECDTIITLNDQAAQERD